MECTDFLQILQGSPAYGISQQSSYFLRVAGAGSGFAFEDEELMEMSVDSKISGCIF